ncbi:C40 family peptidase [Phascolarctobacterium faecium]|jgi:cell wall-associated NlpC family hydrolase|uniref:C40 family peptidase n=1 Tax=Phascolarctobacterium faecium TaxID=33025 RepID=UPI003AB8D267
MNYVSLCKRLAVCTALGIALSLPVGAVWNTTQPQLAYAEEYSSLRGNIIENAYLLVGTPFKMGGSFPSEGFDGSGYVQYVFGESGIALPRTVDEQYDVGRRIGKDDLLPGDLVFYSTDGPGATFCGIYSGDGKFIYAGTKNGVIEGEAFGPYWDERFYGARRIID